MHKTAIFIIKLCFVEELFGLKVAYSFLPGSCIIICHGTEIIQRIYNAITTLPKCNTQGTTSLVNTLYAVLFIQDTSLLCKYSVFTIVINTILFYLI